MPRRFYALAVLCSAAAAFSIQPLAAKALLPTLGGAPGVWSVVAAFFMGAVLLGYVAVHAVHRRFGTRGTSVLVTTLFACALLTMPLDLEVNAGWPGQDALGLRLALRLGTSLGFPALALASVAPAVQSWFAAAAPDEDPYPLYAASNVGSLIGLLAYPFAVEPWSGVGSQLLGWSVLFGLSALLVLSRARFRAEPGATVPAARPRLEPGVRMAWVWHAALPSAALLALTDYVTTDLAPVPLLWVLPLALYLGTWVVAFSPRSEALAGEAAALSPLAGAVVVPLVILGVSLPVVPVLAALTMWFCLCGLCHHGHLARTRPAPAQLTSFYAHLAFGGALGGAFVAFLAPMVFPRALEFPFLLAASLASLPKSRTTRRTWGLALVLAVLGVGLLSVARVELRGGVTVSAAAFGVLVLLFGLSPRRPVLAGRVLAGIVALGTFGLEVSSPVLQTRRSFFAAHRVVEDRPAGLKWLAHGRTVHGASSEDPAVRGQCLPYHHDVSPIAAAFEGVQARRPDAEVVVVGLGVGCLATHLDANATLTFVEIDRVVEELAREHFGFLEECGDACAVHLADGRRAFVQRDRKYDLIVLDAFASDAVPAHLLTTEAIRVYESRLRPGGVIAFHVTNHHVDVEAVVIAGAHALGLEAVVGSYDPARDAERDPEVVQRYLAATTWVFLAREAEDLQWVPPEGGGRGFGPTTRPATRAWTDARSSVLQSLRTRGI